MRSVGGAAAPEGRPLVIPGIGSPLTAGIVYVAAAIVAALLLVIAAQGVAIWWLNGQVDKARKEYAALAEKNGRCEAESSGLKSSLATQTQAVKDWKDQADKNAAIAKKAQDEAAAARKGSDKKIVDILAGKPIDPADLCKSAMHELRRGVRR